jgi:amino acid transporter
LTIDTSPKTLSPNQDNRRPQIRFIRDEKHPDTVIASLDASEPNSPFEQIKQRFLGKPIPEHLAHQEQLSQPRALAILSSDALSSVAYATEASLGVLLVAGSVAININVFIGIAIALLMVIVANSYRQTIEAYPSGGGSYIVASDNLGKTAGLIAAASLLIDYVLTVSVSVAAGTDAIASAFPVLSPVRVELDVAIIALICFVNMRGRRESGTIFSIPTYFFLSSYGIMLLAGILHAITNGGLFAAAAPPATAFPKATENITILLVLTAFASGCSAMTGVEAISNGISVFKGRALAERAKNARQTLTAMIVILVTFFLGTTYLAWRFGTLPNPSGNPTVTAQIAQQIFVGPFSWMYYVVQIATLLVLIFAANTSYADFPLLSAILARDGYLPALFAYRGERIAYNVGIATLSILGGFLLVIFKGNVVELINLYALGVFTAFTLSQAGMVKHWFDRRNTERHWQGHMLANGSGAITTGIVMLVIGITKFDRGAWIVVILVPIMVSIFRLISAHYNRERIIHFNHITGMPEHAGEVIVPLLSHRHLTRRDKNKGTWGDIIVKELRFSADHADRVTVIRVITSPEEAEAFRAIWNDFVKEHMADIAAKLHLTFIISPYRTTVLPLVSYIDDYHLLRNKDTVVLLPVEINENIYERFLQRRIANHVADKLRPLARGGRVRIVRIPYTLGKARHEE